MTAVADRDLRQLADVLDVAHAGAPRQGALPVEVLSALCTLVPSDDVTFADLDVARRTFHILDEYDGSDTSSLPEPEHTPDDPFWRHYPTSRFCSYPTDAGDHKTVTMRADFFSLREWRQTAMYTEGLGADGVTDELMCPLGGGTTRSRRLLFTRLGGSDFTERDRLLLALLRPHLAELIPAPSAPVGAELTPRQMELMRLVAAGQSNAEIAVAMFVSPHTVRKHLENIFERLDVGSRTAAVARVFG